MLTTTFALLSGALSSCATPSPVQQAPREVIVRGRQAKELDEYLTRCAAFGFSGSVYVSRKGKPVLRNGYGTADPLTGAPTTTETLYDIASASKQVTATAIVKLADESRLDLDDSIAKYLPEVPEEYADVTVRHLMHHTAGFPRSGPSGGGDVLAQAVAGYLSGSRSAAPGQRHEYWNGGYALLAGIVETVTGETFEDYVREELFARAGLVRTDFIETWDGGDGLLARTHEDGQKRTTDYIRGWAYRGMGGVLTSADDAGRWMESVLLDDEVISKSAREVLLQPGLGGYAGGWYVLDSTWDNACVQHGGTSPGFQTYLRYFPEEELVTAVLTNTPGTHWQVAWTLEALWFGEEPNVPLPPEPLPIDEDLLETWAGRWTDEAGSELTIQPDHDGLGFAIDARGEVAALLHGETSPLPAEAAVACALVEAIARGDREAVTARVSERFPHWPSVLCEQVWPERLAQWGPLRSVHTLRHARERNGSVTLLLEVAHERGSRLASANFSGGRASRLDFGMEGGPSRVHVAPVAEDRCVAYRFAPAGAPRVELLLSESGRRVPGGLTVKLGGRTIALTHAADRR